MWRQRSRSTQLKFLRRALAVERKHDDDGIQHRCLKAGLALAIALPAKLLIVRGRLGVHPVCVARPQLEFRFVPEPQFQLMESWGRRLRTEAQDVVVWHIVRDGYEESSERRCVLEGKVLTARQLRDGFGHIAL